MSTPPLVVGPELQQSLELLHRLFVAVDTAPGLREREPLNSIVVQLRQQPHLGTLPKVLLRVYAELGEALNGIRRTRETMQAYSVERLRDTHARLSEVSAATETATLEMLNGLDRSLTLIDELEGRSDTPLHARCDALRAEVNQRYSALQFQDIITQQLHAVTALLVEVEQKLETVTHLFGDGTSAAPPVADPGTYNPDASMRDATQRQALIDATFSAARSTVLS